MKNLKTINCLLGALLGLLTILAYYPASQTTFIIDDLRFFVDDPLMVDPIGILKIWLSPLENNRAWPFLPITRSTFWLERQFWGLNFQVTHWLNILLHLLNAVLLWQILRQLRIQGAWLAGSLFAVHPVHVQTVAWISDRKDILSCLFGLLSFWAFQHFEPKRNRGWYLTSIFLFLAALLSKTSAIMLPFVLIAFRVYSKRIWRKNDLFLLLPFFILALATGAVRVWFEVQLFGAGGIQFAMSFLERMVIASHVPFFYLSKLFVPHPLVFIYPKWSINLEAVSSFLPFFSFSVTFVFLSRHYQRWGRPLFWGMGIFFILLFPVLGFFNNSWTRFSFVSDHWVYLPSIPIIVLTAKGGVQIYTKIRPPFQMFTALAGSFLLAGLCLLTWQQTHFYKNEETLWQSTLTKNPKAWPAYNNLGVLFQKRGERLQALQFFNSALEINPQDDSIFYNRGNTHASLQQFDKAISDYNRAIELRSNEADYYNNRGVAYANMNQFERAFRDFQKAVNLDPKELRYLKNRDQLYQDWKKQQ
ncbi:MAG: tetratricopeptide repeat protein [SAR324 cluster bacterium]|nr:tetratricopeptide repeat protein [SAR324 cluster bacterium]